MKTEFEEEYMKMYMQAIKDVSTINLNYSVGVIKPEFAMAKISEILTLLESDEERLLDSEGN